MQYVPSLCIKTVWRRIEYGYGLMNAGYLLKRQYIYMTRGPLDDEPRVVTSKTLQEHKMTLFETKRQGVFSDSLNTAAVLQRKPIAIES